MLSAFLSLFFFTQSSQYQIWKANTYFILTNSNQSWIASVTASTWITKFYDPNDSEHIKNKNRELAIHKFRTGIPLTGNLQS